MKAIKYVLLVLGGVVLLAAVVLAYVALTFDPNKYKPEIISLVKDKTQRTLKLDGDIKLSVFPRIGADLGKVSLSERNSDKEFAGVEAARVSLALMPLLSGQAIVDSVAIKGLRATVVKGRDGKLNIDDLLGGGAPEGEKKEAPAKPAAGAPAAPLAVDISSVLIEDTSLAYRDEASGASYAVSGLKLTTGQLKDGVETPVELAVKLEANKPVLNLAIAAKTRMRFELEAQNLRLSGLDLDAKGDVADIRGLVLKAGGGADLRLKAREMVLDKLALAATGTQGKQAFDVKLDAPSLNLTREKVAGSKIAINASMKGADGTVSAVISMPSLEGSPKAFKVSELSADVDLKQGGSAVKAKVSSPVEGQLDEETMLPLAIALARLAGEVDLQQGANAVKAKLAGAVNAKFDGKDMAAGHIDSPQLSVDFDAKTGANTVKGQLASPVSADLKAQHFSLPKITTTLAVSGPELPNKGFKAGLSGAADANLTKQTVQANISGSFDESQIKAKLGMVNFSKPAYTFDAEIDKLDLDRYMPPSTPKAEGGGKPAAPAGGAKEAKAGKEEPLDFSALADLNATGSVRIGSLKVSNVKASNVRVDLKAAGGKVELAPLSANLYEGSVNGSLALHTDTPSVAVKQELKGISIEPLLKDAAEFDTLSGKGSVSLDVTAQGQTVSAMKKSLAGNAALRLADGAIKGIDVAGSIREAKAKLSSLKGKPATQDADKTKKTDFTELTASFKIKNGVAHNDDLDGKSPLLRLGGAGDIDIGGDRLDYLAKATIVKSTKGQGGAELDSLSGLTVPVKLTGPLAAPKYSIDFGGIAADMAKREVENKLKSKLGLPLPGGAAQEPAAGAAPKEEKKKKPADLLKGLLR